jgi:hypothetical protein
MAMGKVAEKPKAGLYDTDINLWALEQARLLRDRRWADLDLENVAEEIESLGGSQRSEIWNRQVVLLQHLLKWQYQPEKRKYGWRSTINEQRISIERVIETSPSLHRYPVDILARCYLIARSRAADETGIPEKAFPPHCEYSVEQLLDSRFYPGPEEHDVV